MQRLVRCSGGVPEADQTLGRSRNTALDQNVIGFDFAVVEEASCGRDGMVLGVGHAEDALVVLRSLVVSGLTALSNGLSDVTVAEGTHVAVLAALFGVLVGLEFTTESLDDTLPSVSFGDGDDVRHDAFLEGIGEGVFLAQALTGPVELVRHASTGETHFHDVGNFAGHAGKCVG